MTRFLGVLLKGPTAAACHELGFELSTLQLIVLSYYSDTGPKNVQKNLKVRRLYTRVSCILYLLGLNFIFKYFIQLVYMHDRSHRRRFINTVMDNFCISIALYLHVLGQKEENRSSWRKPPGPVHSGRDTCAHYCPLECKC